MGTHADKLRAKDKSSKSADRKILQDIDAMLHETLSPRGVCKNVVMNKEEDNMMFFPVDNTLSDGKGNVDRNVQRLKVVIEDTARKDPTQYLRMTLPIKWMFALDNLLSSSDPYIRYTCDCKEKQSYSSDTKLNQHWRCSRRCKTATQICIDSGVPPSDVEKCMHTLHQRGALLFWRDDDTLRELVVTKPRWLIEKISSVIRTRTVRELKRRWNRKNGGMQGEKWSSGKRKNKVLRVLPTMSRTTNGPHMSLRKKRLHMNSAPRQKEAENKMSDRWNILKKQAIIHEDLLKFLWSDDREDFTKISHTSSSSSSNSIKTKKCNRKNLKQNTLLRAKSDEPTFSNLPVVKLKKSSSAENFSYIPKESPKFRTPEELTFSFLVKVMEFSNLMCEFKSIRSRGKKDLRRGKEYLVIRF